jgi:hypothetical protein
MIEIDKSKRPSAKELLLLPFFSAVGSSLDSPMINERYAKSSELEPTKSFKVVDKLDGNKMFKNFFLS